MVHSRKVNELSEKPIVKKVANKTGEVIEKGVKVAEVVAQEAKPVAKGAIDLGKKGIRAMKKTTLEVAEELKKK
ncbi:MAG: hypothetical protein QW505_05415 [Thermoplasmata archaeon]